MKLELENLKTAINTVQADIGFDPERVEVVAISTTDSFAKIFIQQEINNEGGWARLTGGLPNPGFFGERGTFGTIYFRAKSPGIVQLGFLQSSMVLANDGRGTNILKSLPSVSYLILPESISEQEAREQQKFIIDKVILGVEDNQNDSQLKFFDEGSVLGTQADIEIRENKIFNPTRYLFEGLEALDGLILSFWGIEL